MHVNTPKDIAVYSRERRNELGWSQQTLANKVGVNRSWVIQFERGKATVELGLVLKTLRALDLNLFVEERNEVIDLDELLAGPKAAKDESL